MRWHDSGRKRKTAYPCIWVGCLLVPSPFLTLECLLDKILRSFIDDLFVPLMVAC